MFPIRSLSHAPSAAFVAALLCGLLAGCASQPQAVQANKTGGQTATSFTRGNKSPYEVWGEWYEVLPDSFGYLDIGVASWYGKKFHGRLTSNGEVYDMYAFSAAHKSLPIPSMVKVTNLDNRKSIVLRINDRGPFHDNRLIDLSYAAAKELGFADKGIAPVVVEALDELNHPDRVQSNVETVAGHKTYYLQLGAFSELRWAEALRKQLQGLMAQHENNIDVKILQTELGGVELPTSGEGSDEGMDEDLDGDLEGEPLPVGHQVLHKVLHKVWLGPMDEAQREHIAALVEQASLGVPLRVEVD